MQDVWAEYDALANQVICDPLLGELRPSEMGDPWWETTATVCGRSVVFLIDGEEQPDPALLAHAHEIVREFPSFERRMA
jgi:hypothetical protein